MKKLKIGILGTSNHYLKRIVLPLQDTEYCESYAIGSRNIKKAESMARDFNIPLWYGSYQAVLNDADVDMVYIPLPNHMHKEWVEKCIEAGKPVLCEKPLGMNAAEAQKITEKAQEAGILLMEGFMYMFHPMWKYARDIIRTQQIGDVQYIHTAFSYNNPSPTNIRNIPEYGGGALMDIGCYAISVPRFIMGEEPSQVMSLQTAHPDFGTDMHSSAIMDFGGPRATFTVSTAAQAFQKVDIVTNGGSITIHIPFNTYVDVPAQMTVTDGMGTRIIEFAPSNAYGLMFDAFADAVINNKQLPVSPQDAINNMKVIDAVRKSAETKKWQTP
ncbi:Gfo/Idh/MocA family oxidoreductase [Marinilabilia sp.]|uniref:Gfo/Idh/MocA family protein n=1 Tax=Marinilabilia sp. TaxID=2021252 RepID=UPI0025BFC431|nr:Gfo/Idh/MocA family oxidoreductase [Marinilabilia sp.]